MLDVLGLLFKWLRRVYVPLQIPVVEKMDVQQAGDSADPYSFDAPSHVMHDFSPDSEDNADQWFGKRILSSYSVRCLIITSCVASRGKLLCVVPAAVAQSYCDHRSPAFSSLITE